MSQSYTPSMRTFYTVWLGQLISMIGSGLTSFGLAVWIFDQTGEATPFAITVLLGNLPAVLISPIAGAIVDRWNRRWVMVLADSATAVTMMSAFGLLITGQLAVWHIYIVAGLISLFSAFQEPAYTASVTLLVPKDQLVRANGLIQMGQALQMLIAPLLAGLLFVVIGFEGLALIDGVTFLIAITTLLLVRFPEPKKTETAVSAPSSTFWQDTLFGWHYLRQRAGLFGLLLFFASVNFFLNFAVVLLGPMILSYSNAAAYGTVQAVGGVGMLLGSILISAWGGPKKRVPTVIGFIAVGAVGLLVMGIRPSVTLVSVGMFILLFVVPLGGGLSQAVFQSKVEPAVQGRVFAFRSMISRSMMPLAFALSGPLADRIFEPLLAEGGALAATVVGQIIGTGAGRGIGLLYLISGGLLLCVTLLAFALPAIRHLEDRLPDAIEPDELSLPDTAVSSPIEQTESVEVVTA